MQQVFMMGHENGFQKALHQVALFASMIILKNFDALKDVKNKEIARESQMESFEDAYGNGANSKE